MNKLLPALAITLLFCARTSGQACTPSGDQTSFGTNNTWIGYVYHNSDLTSYAGYVTEGNPGNPSFDQNFGGDDVNYATNGCAVHTSTFSVRYKLRKNFAAGGYQFTVGADDGFRLSLDGGNTWVINRWNDQAYTIETYSTLLDGYYDMVLEFYENQSQNRISFTIETACIGTEDPSVYGTGDVWRGYVYDGINFNIFKGVIQEGAPGNISFDENFGGSNVVYNTSSCATSTETFSVRYRLRKSFPEGNYVFTVGGDDGYRLSLDGGSTWVINRWGDQSYNTETYSTTLSGIYNLVLEYYENGGDNRISLAVQSNVVLDINLLAFTAKPAGQDILLEWDITGDSDPRDFILERSADGRQFSPVAQIGAGEGIKNRDRVEFSFTDRNLAAKKYWYRLRMTDQHQKTTLSHVLFVNRESDSRQDWQVYPTVIDNGVFFIRSNRVSSSAQWDIYDLNGRKLKSGLLNNRQAAQVSSVTIPKGSLPAGLYIVRITENQEATGTYRILVQ